MGSSFLYDLGDTKAWSGDRWIDADPNGAANDVVVIYVLVVRGRIELPT